MLKPEQITNGAEAIAPIIEDMEQRVIKALAKEFKDGFEGISTESRSMIVNAADIGIDLSNVFEELVKTRIITSEQVSQILVSEGLLNIYQENQRLAPLGIELKIEEYPFLKQAVSDYATLAANDITSMMNIDAIGFAVLTANGSRFQLIDTFVKNELEKAAMSVRTGIYDQNEAVEEFVKNIAESGVKTKFKSGYYCDIESAAMRAIVTSVNNMAQLQNSGIADTLDLPYAEVTAHQGARPDHQVWQGRIFKIKGSEPGYPNLAEATGLGTPTGLLGINCRHQWHGWDKGLPKTYTDEELENLDPPPIEYEGKEYTYYQATQKQRAFERAIRQTKREMAGFEGVGDSDNLAKAEKRLSTLNKEYKKFSDAMGIKTHRDRTAVYQSTKSNKTPSFSSTENTLKNYTDEEIIKLSSEMDKTASSHISVPSKWSGNTIIDNGKNPGKLWNCDIRVKNKTSENIVLHEHVHARSVSYFDEKTYYDNSIMEEASVQLASREICKKEGFATSTSEYDNDVDLLSKAGNMVGYSDNYSFAMELIKQELPSRIDWIRNKGYNTLKTIGDYNDLEDLLLKLEGGYDKRR